MQISPLISASSELILNSAQELTGFTGNVLQMVHNENNLHN